MPNDPSRFYATEADKKKTEEENIERDQLAMESFTMAFTGVAELMEYV